MPDLFYKLVLVGDPLFCVAACGGRGFAVGSREGRVGLNTAEAFDP